jgi:hypothetical protein
MSRPVPVLPDELAAMLDDASPAADAASDQVAADFLANHQSADRPELLASWTTASKDRFKGKGSRHDCAASTLAGALKEARAGYFPAQEAVDALRPLFLSAVTRRPRRGERQRTATEAEHEWRQMVAWAVAQANAADLNDIHARVAERFPEKTASRPRIVVHRSVREQAAALEMAHRMFRYWLGQSYDIDALNTVLAAAAARGWGPPLGPVGIRLRECQDGDGAEPDLGARCVCGFDHRLAGRAPFSYLQEGA